MISKTITYPDFDGNERTETFYFHIMKSELVEIQSSVDGGFDKYLQRIIDTQDQNELLKFIKELILMSYGVRSEDGRGFKKSKELSDSFSYTEAFSNLYMELISDEKEAEAFIKGVIPNVEMPSAKLPATKAAKITSTK